MAADSADRVTAARDSIGEKLEKAVLDFGAKPGSEIFLRAFKQEKRLELWMKKDSVFNLFRSYPICFVPGKLGPKRKQGDLQVPEGVYFIDRFNPKSNYHLSLGINYPNESDRLFADKEKPGGDIFIHGDCVSIGCIPIEDEKIEEVYLLALDATTGGQERIFVHIFPFLLDDMNLQNMLDGHFLNIENSRFWENLQQVY
ncbi:MAG: murein L,D-transpeptidase family protein, partial [Saprospiraceae bacterium]